MTARPSASDQTWPWRSESPQRRDEAFCGILPGMLIEVPQHFRHPGELFGPAASLRPNQIPDEVVEVDLRSCSFVRPAAVLWCVIYPLLAAQTGKHSVVLVPEDRGAASYLKALRLFDVLREGGV